MVALRESRKHREGPISTTVHHLGFTTSLGSLSKGDNDDDDDGGGLLSWSLVMHGTRAKPEITKEVLDLLAPYKQSNDWEVRSSRRRAELS